MRHHSPWATPMNVSKPVRPLAISPPSTVTASRVSRPDPIPTRNTARFTTTSTVVTTARCAAAGRTPRTTR